MCEKGLNCEESLGLSRRSPTEIGRGQGDLRGGAPTSASSQPTLRAETVRSRPYRNENKASVLVALLLPGGQLGVVCKALRRQNGPQVVIIISSVPKHFRISTAETLEYPLASLHSNGRAVLGDPKYRDCRLSATPTPRGSQSLSQTLWRSGLKVRDGEGRGSGYKTQRTTNVSISTPGKGEGMSRKASLRRHPIFWRCRSPPRDSVRWSSGADAR